MAGPEGSTNGQTGWVSSAEQDGPVGGQATRHFSHAPEVGGPCLRGSFRGLGQRHTGRALGLRDAQMGGPQNPFRDPRPGPGHTEELGSGRCPWSWKGEAAAATSIPSEDRCRWALGLLWLSLFCSGRD